MHAIAAAFGRFFFACIFLLPISAHAAALEIGIGMAQSQDRGNGTWYQNGFPHTLGLRSPVAEIGLHGDFMPWLAWHTDLVDLGRYSVNSLDTPDANYSATSQTHCNGACLPLAHYSGSGSIYGLSATLEAHTTGSWQIGIEAGPLLYHHTWALSVPDWYPSTETSPGVFSAGPVSPVSTSDSGWALGGVVGLSLEHSGLGLSLRHYSDGKGFPRGTDPWPPIWSGQTVLMLTYSFN